MTVEEMLSKLTSSELTEWAAYLTIKKKQEDKEQPKQPKGRRRKGG
jgi:hypothetical protein